MSGSCSPKFESRRGKLLRDGCACAARVKLGMRNVLRVHLTDIWSWYRVELRVGDHLGRSEELVSRCVECDLAEPESLASLGGSAPGVVDGILSKRLVDAGGEEDHQPHEKPTKHPTPVPNREKSAQSDTPTVYINSRHDDGPTSSKPLPRFNPDELVGRTFLLPPGDNGERLGAKVTRKVVEDIEQADGERVQKLSFILGIGNGKLEEIISYNQLVDHLEATANDDKSVMICSSLEPSLAGVTPQANRPQLERMQV